MSFQRQTLSVFLLCLAACSAAPIGAPKITTPPDVRAYKEGQKRNKTRIAQIATLADLEEVAIRRSPILKAQYQLYLSTKAAAHASAPLPDPFVTWSWYARAVETRDGPQRHKVTITQKIPWLTKLSAATRAATGKMYVAAARLTSLKALLLFRVRASWFVFWQVHESIRLLKTMGKTIEVMHDLFEARYKGSAGTTSMLLKLKLEHEKIHNRIGRLTARSKVVQAALANHLGVTRLSLKPPHSLPRVQSGLTLAGLSSKLKKHSPLLMESTRQVLQQQAVLLKSKKDGLPDFTLNLGYIETGSTNLPGAVHSGRDPIIVTLGISIPLWRAKLRAGERAEKARLSYLRWRKEVLRIRLLTSLRSRFEEFREAAREENRYHRRLIPIARLALKTTIDSFKAGQGRLLLTLEMVRDLLSLQIGLIGARRRQALAVAQMERLAGVALFRPATAPLVTSKTSIKQVSP